MYNNKKEDEKILKSFNEPSWNNPVVRYLSADGKDLIPRADRIWTTQGTAKRMLTALTKTGNSVPRYLHLLAESPTSKLETAEFAMHCYWEGEAKLGAIPGVYSTRSGWREKLEVVQLKYDPATVDYKTLLSDAQKFDCASKVFAHTEAQLKLAKQIVGKKATKAVGPMRDAKASDQRYYLLNSPLRYLPMPELQATKANAMLGQKKSPESLLSPRQFKLVKEIHAALSKDKESLKKFVPPNDSKQFAEYQEKLEKHLMAINKK